MDFDQIPQSLRKPGAYLEFNARLAARSLPANRQSVLLIGQRLDAAIRPAVFSPAVVSGAVNDLTSGGAFTGTVRRKFVVEITTAAGTDKFRWSKTGGRTWDATDVSVTGSAQTLAEGVTVTFGATTGHNDGDVWTFYADPAGTQAELEAVQVYSAADAAIYFGQGSQLHVMAAAALAANPYVALYAIAQDDAGAGAAAAAGIDVTAGGTAGTLSLWVGNTKYAVAVAADDTAQDIASALCLAIAADAACPVFATWAYGDGGTDITLAAKNKGTQGNALALEYAATNGCATLSITPFASGATDPDIQDALDVVYPDDFNVIATAFNDTVNLGVLAVGLEIVSGPLEQRPRIGVFGFVGATADAMSLASDTNSGRIVGAMLKASRSHPIEIAAALASVVAFEEDPAKPLNTLALTGIAAPGLSDGLSRTEQEALLHGGITPLAAGTDGVVRIVRAATTYLLNASGVEDAAYLDITTIRTLDYVRSAVQARVLSEFARSKLSTSTPARVRSSILDTLMRLEDAEIVENVAANADGLVVEINADDPNRLDAAIPCDVVNGLHVFAGRIDLIL